jgi:hypothetical protein
MVTQRWFKDDVVAFKIGIVVMFNIITSEDFLVKLEADYADFKLQPDAARHALNCIITAYHLIEWVWGDWLKKDYVTRQSLGCTQCAEGRSCIDIFKERLAAVEWPSLTVVQAIANGAKHFRIEKGSVVETTQRITGYGKGPYGVGPFGRPYLLIDYGTEAPQRWTTADQLLDDTLEFWRKFFKTYRSKSDTDK